MIRTEDEDWAIEIERTLNYEAIGQVTAYEELWKETRIEKSEKE